MYSNEKSADQRKVPTRSCYSHDRNSHSENGVPKLVRRNSHCQLVLLSVLLIVTLSHFPSTSALCEPATSSFQRGLIYSDQASLKAKALVDSWCRVETKTNRAFLTCLTEKGVAKSIFDPMLVVNKEITQNTLSYLHRKLLSIRLAVMEREKAAQAIKAAAGKDEDYFNELVEYSSKIIHEVGYVLERFGGHTPIVDRPTYCQPKPENDATRKQKNWKVIQDYLDTVELVFQAFRSLKIKYCW